MKSVRKLASIIIIILLFSCCKLSVSGAGERVITDMAGRRVELPAEIERVVTTYHTASKFVFALGAQQRIVAAETDFSRIRLFAMLLPGIEEIPTVGSKRKGLNLEEIIAAEPELVLLYPYHDGLTAAEKLAEQGIAAVIIQPESYRQIRQTNLLLGQVLNLEEKAQQIDQQYQKILELAARTRAISPSDRPTVYFANSQLLDSVGDGMLQSSLIELAGGINPAKGSKQGFIQISAEELYQWNPELIVTSQRFRGELTELIKTPAYQGIKAFQNKAIHRTPANLEAWDFPGPASYLMILWLADKLYPELYRDIDLPALVEEFYREVYGKGFTALGGQLSP